MLICVSKLYIPTLYRTLGNSAVSVDEADDDADIRQYMSQRQLSVCVRPVEGGEGKFSQAARHLGGPPSLKSTEKIVFQMASF